MKKQTWKKSVEFHVKVIKYNIFYVKINSSFMHNLVIKSCQGDIQKVCSLRRGREWWGGGRIIEKQTKTSKGRRS